MVAIECFHHGLRQGGFPQIGGQHRGPSHGLQHHPMPADGRDERDRQQQVT